MSSLGQVQMTNEENTYKALLLNSKKLNITSFIVKMSFVKQGLSLNIKNLDIFQPNEKNKRSRHGKLFPDFVRAILCGPSNAGKTNLLINMLHNPNGLRYENIYIFSKSLNQSKYKLLREILTPVKGLGYYTFSENCNVLPPERIKPNSIMIFDDVSCDRKQDNIRAYFCRGRHYFLDTFFLCQTYANCNKHNLRDNANFIILFKQDDLNLRHIWSDHVNTDYSFEHFRNICRECWSKNNTSNSYGFLVIDKESPLNEGRYRRNFDEFYTTTTTTPKKENTSAYINKCE